MMFIAPYLPSTEIIRCKGAKKMHSKQRWGKMVFLTTAPSLLSLCPIGRDPCYDWCLIFGDPVTDFILSNLTTSTSIQFIYHTVERLSVLHRLSSGQSNLGQGSTVTWCPLSTATLLLQLIPWLQCFLVGKSCHVFTAINIATSHLDLEFTTTADARQLWSFGLWLGSHDGISVRIGCRICIQ